MILEKIKQHCPGNFLAWFALIVLAVLFCQFVTAQAQSKPLQGSARRYEKSGKVTGPLLKGKALLDAYKQFKLDLSRFSEHAKIYDLHIADARQSLGPYQAGTAACQKMKKEMNLDCTQFHIKLSSVKPPASCLHV